MRRKYLYVIAFTMNSLATFAAEIPIPEDRLPLIRQAIFDGSMVPGHAWTSEYMWENIPKLGWFEFTMSVDSAQSGTIDDSSVQPLITLRTEFEDMTDSVRDRHHVLVSKVTASDDLKSVALIEAEEFVRRKVNIGTLVRPVYSEQLFLVAAERRHFETVAVVGCSYSLKW